MEKPFGKLVAVLVTGLLAIALLYYLSSQSEEKKVIKEKQKQEQIQSSLSERFNEKPKKLETSVQRKPLVIQGKNKMYFKGIEKLEQDFKKEQVDDIKLKVQMYVHQYISNDLIECIFKPESLKHVDNTISFELSLEGVKQFEVNVLKDRDNKIVDITMLYSL